MIEITKIKVKSFAFDRLSLTWEIADTTEEVHDYLLSVYRSESPGGPWDLVAGDLEDRYAYLDIDVDLRHRWRRLYYKIRVTKKSDSTYTETDPVSLAAPIDLIAAEVQGREQMHFQRNVGRKMLLFPVRTFGPKCHCHDAVMGLNKVKRCLNCYGTGRLRGYLNPEVTWVQFDPSTKSNQLLPDAKTQQTHTVARTPSFPEVKPEDVLVEAENRRWRVVTVGQTERLRAALRQELRLSEIMQGDIEFDLPVDESVFTDATEIRHFSRPSTI